MPDEKSDKPALEGMSDEQLRLLEKSLTRFVSDLKSSRKLPESLASLRMRDSEHSSHVSA